MVRSLCTFAVIVAASIYSNPAEAQIFQDFKRSVVRDFNRNNCWPAPFMPTDRVGVRAPFNIMVRNGWKRQNMISDFHFDDTGQQLSKAGELKIRWVLTETPPHHRTIYVHRAKSREETDIRIATVRKTAESILPRNTLLAVEEVAIGMEGWPSERVSTMLQQFREMKQPDLEMILVKPVKEVVKQDDE